MVRRDTLPAMQHLNGDVLLSLATMEHEGQLVGVGAVISDEWLRQTTLFPPFACMLKPRVPVKTGKYKRTADDMNAQHDSYNVADVFEEWFDSLNLFPKQFQVLMYDVRSAFLVREWLSPTAFERLFSFKVRLLQSTALAMNDSAHFNKRPYPHPKAEFSTICTRSGVEFFNDDPALRAVSLLEAYRRAVGGIL